MHVRHLEGRVAVANASAGHVKRMSIYVQTKMIRTRSTIPSVMQVVPRDFDDTVPRCFFDFWVDARLSSARQHRSDDLET